VVGSSAPEGNSGTLLRGTFSLRIFAYDNYNRQAVAEIA
jgi:hypothetical protein